ncbi:hypothetical protein [Propioniciclava soli]|uniref:hypothetical protein n=1 Tax=Propioniciclava soli TaxID=2775081 RepID=UPI001E2FB184|nr:hypothetical protein [Propioniciclava soli]
MAIYAFASAGGSPGVTTTVLALGSVWPRPVVVVEADPTGGSAVLAGFYQGMVDQPGLIQLVMAHRRGQLAHTLPSLLRGIEGTQASVLVGTRSHDQSVGLETLWSPLLETLRRLEDNGQDVLVDAGRLGLVGSPMPLLVGADITTVLVRSNLTAVSAARSWVQTLKDRSAGQLGVVVVGGGRPYSSREVASALDVPLIGDVEWCPEAAAVFSEGAGYPRPGGLSRLAGRAATKERFARSGYVRSVTTAGDVLRRQTRSVLTPEVMAQVKDGVQ